MKRSNLVVAIVVAALAVTVVHESWAGPKRRVRPSGHEAGSLKGAQQAQRRTRRKAGSPGAFRQHDGVLFADYGEQAERPIDGAGGGSGGNCRRHCPLLR